MIKGERAKGLEISLGNAMSRELILKEYVDLIRDAYDYILVTLQPMTRDREAAASSSGSAEPDKGTFHIRS